MAASKSGQVNLRSTPSFERDLALIQKENGITERAHAIRHVVHREAARIRRRNVRSTK